MFVNESPYASPQLENDHPHAVPGPEESGRSRKLWRFASALMFATGSQLIMSHENIGQLILLLVSWTILWIMTGKNVNA